MSQILIVFASHHGMTRKIAGALADRLRTRGHVVDLAETTRGPYRLPPPGAYDAVVLGSRIEVGRHATALLGYIRDHREVLQQMPTAFFSVSMAAASPSASADPSGYLAATFEDLDWHPAHAVAFAGGLPYRRYGWITRFVMKRIARAHGQPTDTTRDHELTDWAAVAAFADKIDYIAGGRSPVKPANAPELRTN
jgi:menaquinone-dependent protoporphyrinogen oxidase